MCDQYVRPVYATSLQVQHPLVCTPLSALYILLCKPCAAPLYSPSSRARRRLQTYPVALGPPCCLRIAVAELPLCKHCAAHSHTHLFYMRAAGCCWRPLLRPPLFPEDSRCRAASSVRSVSGLFRTAHAMCGSSM
eukprot:scaffold7100_cov24-Tisochrysis_lutea.AAC.1